MGGSVPSWDDADGVCSTSQAELVKGKCEVSDVTHAVA